MKKGILVLLISLSLKSAAQNEFAATAFYTSLREFYTDAQNGFVVSKGTKIPENPNTFTDEYSVKSLLPLADSGKIVWPLLGNPYVVFYLETAKRIEEAEKRAGNLREVIEKVFNQRFFIMTESRREGASYFTDSYFYTNQQETRKFKACFRITVLSENNRYKMQFEIRGNDATL